MVKNVNNMKLFIWLVKRVDPVGYDQYDGVIVIASSAFTALNVNPNPVSLYPWGCADPKLSASLIGLASPGFVDGEIILSSYHAS